MEYISSVVLCCQRPQLWDTALRAGVGGSMAFKVSNLASRGFVMKCLQLVGRSLGGGESWHCLGGEESWYCGGYLWHCSLVEISVTVLVVHISATVMHISATVMHISATVLLVGSRSHNPPRLPAGQLRRHDHLGSRTDVSFPECLADGCNNCFRLPPVVSPAYPERSENDLVLGLLVRWGIPWLTD